MECSNRIYQIGKGGRNLFWKKISKLTAFVIAITMLIMSIPQLGFTEEEATPQYAEAVFGATIKKTNMSKVTATNFVLEEKGGRTGLRTNLATDAISIWINLDNDFMYQLEPDTPVDITIEYYDDIKGAMFGFNYDSSKKVNEQYAEGHYGRTRESSTMVTCVGDKKWKTYTYHLEDFYAGERLSNEDIQLGLWTATHGISKSDVLFGSVKIEYSDFDNPMRYDGATTGTLGNMHTIDEEITLTNTYTNKSKKPISVEIKNLKIYDQNNTIVEEYPDTVITIEGKSEYKQELKVTKADKMGAYFLRGDTYTNYTDTPDDIRAETLLANFSRSYLFKAGEGSEEYGALIHFTNGQSGDIEDVAKVLAASGVTWTRVDCPDLTLTDGTWKLPESFKNDIRVLKEHGINLLIIVNTGSSLKEGTRDWAAETPEELAIFKKYTYDLAVDLRGLVDHFEIWNEPDHESFNPRGTTPEQYTQMYKVGYASIKEAQPESKVFVFSTAAASDNRVNMDYIKRSLDAGAYPYFDAVTIHPYDWTQYFRAEEYVEDIQGLKDMLEEYGGVKPIWSTEMGFSSPQNATEKRGRTLRRQANNLILSRALSKAYDLLEVFMFFEYNNQFQTQELQENWGVINAHDSKDDTPFSAKPSFVAMATFSHYINHNAEILHNLSRDGIYVFDFYNKQLGKNVAFLQTADLKGNVGRGLRLGTKSVELYDMFGNKIATLQSDDGIYHFSVDETAVYVVGDFTTFEEVEYAPHVTSSQKEHEGVVGDTLKIDFMADTAESLEVLVDGSVGISENVGIHNGKGSLSFIVPDGDDGRVTYENKKVVYFTITVKDKSGNVLYCEEHSVEVLKPVEVEISSEMTSPASSNYWRVRVNVKNLRNSRNMGGTIELLSPEEISKSSLPRKFAEIEPLKTGTFIFNLPEKVNKNSINLELKLTLDDGYTESFSKNLDFTTAAYAYKKPVIDGEIEKNEWAGSWIGASEEKDINLMPGWQGADDASFSANLMWDEENMYMAFIGRDDIHYIDPVGDITRMWATDSIQFAVELSADVDPLSLGEFEEFAIAEVTGQGAKAYRHKTRRAREIGEVLNIDLEVVRHDGYTVYECAFPWSEIFGENHKIDPNVPFRFSALLNDHDNDADGRGYIQYSAGIGTSKSMELFSVGIFTK